MGNSRAGGNVIGIVVRNIGSQTTDSPGRTSRLVDISEDLSTWLQVSGPPEPSGVSTIKVHGDVGKAQPLQGVCGTVLIGTGSSRALGNTHVGDHVTQAVWLDDKDNIDIWVLDQNVADGINILGLVNVDTVAGNRKLSVGRLSSVVTVWKAIDDKRSKSERIGSGSFLSTDTSKTCVQAGDLGTSITDQ